MDGGAEAVEAGVELGDQFLAAGLVLPHPCAEPVHQLAALGLGGDGGGAVDGRSAAQFDVGGRPVDHDRLRVQGALEQVDRVAVPGPHVSVIATVLRVQAGQSTAHLPLWWAMVIRRASSTSRANCSTMSGLIHGAPRRALIWLAILSAGMTCRNAWT